MNKHVKLLSKVSFLVKLKLKVKLSLSFLFLSIPIVSSASELQVGAAKVDFSIWAESQEDIIEGIHDPVHSRAIVIANPVASAALVSVDIGGMRDDTWLNVGKRMERELGIPAEHLILTATHSHSVARADGKALEDAIFRSIKQAQANMQKAKMSLGEGVSYINVNRNITLKESGRWWEGPNYDGVSDKTVAVLYFSNVKDEPIAVLYNYAMHAVIAGQLDQISADVPGAASRYIEASLGNNAIALWSEGAAGDQNPIYFQQTYDLRELRVQDYASRGEDITNAMPPGGTGLDRDDPKVKLLMDQQKQMLLSMGQMLGEEVLHTLRSNMQRPRTEAEIIGLNSTIQCPGRKRLDKGRAGYPGKYEDANPVDIRLSLLKIGYLVIGGVNAELFNKIGLRFKNESPYKHTMMATLTNGYASSGYIPSDEAFNYHTFEVLSSKLKPGCAENAIVEGLLDLIEKAD